MLNKLPQETPDLTTANIDKIDTLFPNVIILTKGEDGKIAAAYKEFTKEVLIRGEKSITRHRTEISR